MASNFVAISSVFCEKLLEAIKILCTRLELYLVVNWQVKLLWVSGTLAVYDYKKLQVVQGKGGGEFLC